MVVDALKEAERKLRLEHQETIRRVRESELMGRIRELFANDPLFKEYNTHKNHVDFLDYVENTTYFGHIRVEWKPSEDTVEDWIKDVLNDGQNTAYANKPLNFSSWCAYEVYERQPDFGLDDLHFSVNAILEKMRSGENEDLRKIAEEIVLYDMVEAMQNYDVLQIHLNLIEPELRVNLLLGTKTEIDNEFKSIGELKDALSSDSTAKIMLGDSKQLSKNMDNAFNIYLEAQGYSLDKAMLFNEDSVNPLYQISEEMEKYPSGSTGCLTTLLRAKPNEIFKILTSPSIKIKSHAPLGIYNQFSEDDSNKPCSRFWYCNQPNNVVMPNLIYDVEVEGSSRNMTVDKLYNFKLKSDYWKEDAIEGVKEKPDPKLLSPKTENIEKLAALIRERMEIREKESEDTAPGY